MSFTEIPLSVLKKRAKVERLDTIAETKTVVYPALPCRLSRFSDYDNEMGASKSTETQHIWFFCNRKFNNADVDLRYKDTLTIGNLVYKLVDVHDTESADHHIEGEVELLRKPGSQVD